MSENQKFRIQAGETVKHRGFQIKQMNGTRWYRHDAVYVGNRRLEGSIQVRDRNGRIEVTTCFHGSCVRGANPAWLLRQNDNPESQGT